MELLLMGRRVNKTDLVVFFISFGSALVLIAAISSAISSYSDEPRGDNMMMKDAEASGGDGPMTVPEQLATTGVYVRPERKMDEGKDPEFELKMDGVVRSVSDDDDSGEGPWAALMKAPEGRSQEDAHASSIIQVQPSGDFLVTWFSGSEGNDGVAIALARLPAGSSVWSPPVLVSAQEGRSAQNPVLFQDPQSKTLHLFHTSQAAFLGQGTAEVRWLHSEDQGVTWTEPQTLFTEAGAFVRNQLLVSKSGGWLLPMYYTPNGFGDFATHYSVIKETDDKGATWTEYPMTTKGDWLAQPSVARLKSGALFGFHRDRHGTSLYSTRSENDGKTWSKATKIKLPNNNSGIQVTAMKSGFLALVFNNLQGGIRTPLSVALSEDDGVTWPYVRDLDTEMPGDFSYPSVIEGQDGFLHITYTFHRETIKYVKVSTDWIKRGKSSGMFKGE